ncbi:MAG: RDD family protein [Candidatus Odinarchaeota archaeon]
MSRKQMNYCPFCYSKIGPKDIFCPSCGKKVRQPKGGPARAPAPAPPPAQPSYYRAPPPKPSYVPPDVPPQPEYYGAPSPIYDQMALTPAHPGYVTPAKCEDRCIAYCLDNLIGSMVGIALGIMTCGIGCYAGTCYQYFKDGYNEGRSPGKGAMGLRVINYNTGYPATYGESCIRNCCNICPPTVICNNEYRHIGDLIAGTMVIQDR